MGATGLDQDFPSPAKVDPVRVWLARHLSVGDLVKLLEWQEICKAT